MTPRATTDRRRTNHRGARRAMRTGRAGRAGGAGEGARPIGSDLVAGSTVWPPRASHPPATMHPTTTTAAMMTDPTESARVPLSPTPSRARRYWIAFGVAVGVLAAAVTAASLVEIPSASL